MGSNKLADVSRLPSARFQKEIQVHFSFCKMEEETTSPLFYYCTHIQDIWNQVHAYFTDFLHFPQLTPQTAIFAFHNIDNDTFLIQNHILLLLELHIYNVRKYEFLSFNNFLNEISKIENSERRVAVNNWNKCERFRKKWHRIKVLYYLMGNKQKKSTFDEPREGGRVG